MNTKEQLKNLRKHDMERLAKKPTITLPITEYEQTLKQVRINTICEIAELFEFSVKKRILDLLDDLPAGQAMKDKP